MAGYNGVIYSINDMKFNSITIIRQALVIILIGVAPTLVVFFNSTSNDEFFKNTNSLMIDSNVVEYCFAIWIIYIVALPITKFIFFNSRKNEKLALFFFDILKEAASVSKSFFQVSAGLIGTMIVLWVLLEPVSFSIKHFIFYFIFNFCLVVMAAFIDSTLNL